MYTVYTEDLLVELIEKFIILVCLCFIGTCYEYKVAETYAYFKLFSL